eukprot:1775821-Pleurochrysis_carterae.AAC.2
MSGTRPGASCNQSWLNDMRSIILGSMQLSAFACNHAGAWKFVVGMKLVLSPEDGCDAAQKQPQALKWSMHYGQCYANGAQVRANEFAKAKTPDHAEVCGLLDRARNTLFSIFCGRN